MSAFAQCSKLERLDLLHQRSVTLEGLQTLSSLTSLQELALGPCPAACNDGAALLVQHSVLTKLTLHQDPSLSRPSLASRPFSAGLHSSAHVATVMLCNTVLPQSHSIHIAMLEWVKCSFMQDACTCQGHTGSLTIALGAVAEVFLHIAKLPALQSLEVSGWDDPSMSADWSQLRQLSTLTSLTLSSCQHPRLGSYKQLRWHTYKFGDGVCPA